MAGQPPLQWNSNEEAANEAFGFNCEFTISAHPELPSYRDRFELHEPTTPFEGGSAKRRECLEPSATADF